VRRWVWKKAEGRRGGGRKKEKGGRRWSLGVGRITFSGKGFALNKKSAHGGKKRRTTEKMTRGRKGKVRQ